jgi:hypothetical protein
MQHFVPSPNALWIWLPRPMFFGEVAENGTPVAWAPQSTGAAPVAVDSI